MSRIDGGDDEVDEYIDWQLCRYLAGDPLEDVVADLDKCITPLASAVKVRYFPVAADCILCLGKRWEWAEVTPPISHHA